MSKFTHENCRNLRGIAFSWDALSRSRLRCAISREPPLKPQCHDTTITSLLHLLSWHVVEKLQSEIENCC